VLTNAVDAVSRDPQIMVSTLVAGSGQVRIVIADNGCGILPGDLPSVFEPFFTTKVAAEGAGLGLSIAQRIIEDHHGTISVNSTEGEGTVVAIALPASETKREPAKD
jgi:two-component system NtrC family sensor kinase